jgi:hypothetical protein
MLPYLPEHRVMHLPNITGGFVSAITRKTLPAKLLLAAAGVATGTAIMTYFDQGVVAWSRLASAALLLVLAAGYSKFSREGTSERRS